MTNQIGYFDWKLRNRIQGQPLYATVFSNSAMQENCKNISMDGIRFYLYTLRINCCRTPINKSLSRHANCQNLRDAREEVSVISSRCGRTLSSRAAFFEESSDFFVSPEGPAEDANVYFFFSPKRGMRIRFLVGRTYIKYVAPPKWKSEKNLSNFQQNLMYCEIRINFMRRMEALGLNFNLQLSFEDENDVRLALPLAIIRDL